MRKAWLIVGGLGVALSAPLAYAGGSGLISERSNPRSDTRTADFSKADNPESCARRYRIYLASLACFERFRNVNGSLKPEAFQYCNEVIDPGPQCGPPRY